MSTQGWEGTTSQKVCICMENFQTRGAEPIAVARGVASRDDETIAGSIDWVKLRSRTSGNGRKCFGKFSSAGRSPSSSIIRWLHATYVAAGRSPVQTDGWISIGRMRMRYVYVRAGIERIVLYCIVSYRCVQCSEEFYAGQGKLARGAGSLVRCFAAHVDEILAVFDMDGRDDDDGS